MCQKTCLSFRCSEYGLMVRHFSGDLGWKHQGQGEVILQKGSEDLHVV